MPRAVVLALALALGTATYAADAYTPAVNFQLQCMGCHHADGAGEPGRVPSLRRTLVAFAMLPEGREFVIRVPGVAQSTLSDAETAELLNWMARHLSDAAPPEGFANFTAEEVARSRHHPLPAVAAARADLMRRVVP
jgi:mono/diheme cytochrome c family protein